MKTSKKVLAVFMSVFMLLASFGCMAFAKTSEDVDTHLQFNKNGEFKIVQFTDIQDDFPLMTITKKLIRKALDTQNPDLVVLTGDNINVGAGKSMVTAPLAINEFMSIFEEYGVPVAVVFGNHDTEGSITRATQIGMYEKYSCFIGCTGEELDGYTSGTYYVPVYSSADKNDMAYNLWMIDSGDYNTVNDLGGYAAVSEEQIEWYKKTEARLSEANGGVPVPSLVFQHIVVPEIFDALEVADASDSAVVEKNDVFYKLPAGAVGTLIETPCPPNYNTGEFDAFRDNGDVAAIFFGHDHLNSYEVEYEGIVLCNTPGTGFSSYNGVENGFRVITLHEDDTAALDTQVVTYLEMFEGDEEALALFDFSSETTDFLTKVKGFFKYVIILIQNALASFKA